MEKNMQFNFDMLEERILDSLSVTDLKSIRKELAKIKGNTACIGVGGSSVVSEYAAKVLRNKNNILAINEEPRNMIYINLNNYENVVSCSYSGNNYGVDVSFNNELKKYLLSRGVSERPDVTNLQYSGNLPKEKSFISLAATLIPMAILLDYYLDGDLENVYDSLYHYQYNVDNSDVYEIMSGYDTSSASKFLESTMVESRIATPVVHDKYSFCHGRSTLGYHSNNSLIYFDRGTKLDQLLLEELKEYYHQVIVIDGNYSDYVVDDFNLTIKTMYLAKAIAEAKGCDLSGVEYSPVVKKLYKYNDRM